jgi:hypothetical protein
MLFVVSNEGKDLLVNLNTGLIFYIGEFEVAEEKREGICFYGKDMPRGIQLCADPETLARFRELVRKTKEKG